jgi:Transposase DDE domain
LASIINQMTEIYCFVDDFLKEHTSLAHWRRSPNDEPSFTDAEVITIALMQSCLGVDSLKQTYNLINNNYASAFPLICSYQQWIARLHRLSPITGRLFESARRAGRIRLYLADSKPIPVCKPIRHGRVRLLREDGAYFGKTSAGWFFGFKLHTLRDINGCIVDAILTPGNIDDRDPALELAQSVDGGILLGDLGYEGPKLAQLLYDESELLLITRRDVPEQRELHSSVRQGIETLFSQLWHKFIDRVFSRSWRGLWNTIKLKLLNYNLRHSGILSA